MTKEEVKREHKDKEGDPHVKGRLRSLRQEMARRRMMAKVPEASVIVTNPTHFAVALQYAESDLGAPRVIAKGRDLVAWRIREIAEAHTVPVLQTPPLARALYHNVDLDHEVPVELYTAVAEVVAWAIKLRKANASEKSRIRKPSNIVVPADMDMGYE